MISPGGGRYDWFLSDGTSNGFGVPVGGRLFLAAAAALVFAPIHHGFAVNHGGGGPNNGLGGGLLDGVDLEGSHDLRVTE